MQTALERRAKRLDVSTRPRGFLAPQTLVAGASAALVAAAVLFSDGSADNPLIWIGGLAIVAAAFAAVSAAVGTLAVPGLTVFGAVSGGAVFGLVLLVCPLPL